MNLIVNIRETVMLVSLRKHRAIFDYCSPLMFSSDEDLGRASCRVKGFKALSVVHTNQHMAISRLLCCLSSALSSGLKCVHVCVRVCPLPYELPSDFKYSTQISGAHIKPRLGCFNGRSFHDLVLGCNITIKWM